jgi:hypothetical protein
VEILVGFCFCVNVDADVRVLGFLVIGVLENQGVGIGDHTANDFLKDATESLQLLAEAEDRLEMINKYFSE